ncbi:MAG: hypothetical protein Q8O67_30275 [Deltaproteobacteria bacterium]|nr:hypothetical protein [Deltaproteobacteria bacterium]
MRILSRTFSVPMVLLALVSCNDELAEEDVDNCFDAAGDPLPVAPIRERVDLDTPAFSNPIDITNPLFPISELESAVFLGFEAGAPLRIETTLLPGSVGIDVDGDRTQTLASQFVAFVDGRIVEATIDHFAQANDGAVWYFGEDVQNFDDGRVEDTDGTWRAGREGAEPAMIMPAEPAVGDVFRPENFCGVVFEEATVRDVDVDVLAPSGLVSGAVVIEMLTADGGTEEKVFAPGYGEFRSGVGADVEEIAVAVPHDRLATTETKLAAVSQRSADVFFAAGQQDWTLASAGIGELNEALDSLEVAEDLPTLLKAQLDDAILQLERAIADQSVLLAQHRAIAVARANFDLLLRERATVDVDRARFDLWLAQIIVDEQAGADAVIEVRAPGDGAIRGDTTAAELTFARFRLALDETSLDEITEGLTALRAAADDDDEALAALAAAELRTLIDGTGWNVPELLK